MQPHWENTAFIDRASLPFLYSRDRERSWFWKLSEFITCVFTGGMRCNRARDLDIEKNFCMLRELCQFLKLNTEQKWWNKFV